MASVAFDAGDADSGYVVNVQVLIIYEGKTYHTVVDFADSFTPQC